MEMAQSLKPLIVPKAEPEKNLPMPDGLQGYWWETNEVICVPVVITQKAGTFSLFLKNILSKGKIVFFPTVVSARLDAILRAKGFVDAITEMNDEEQEIYGQRWCDGLAFFPPPGR